MKHQTAPSSFCPFLHLGDKRCLPSRLSASNLDEVIERCAFGWRECPVYQAISSERSAAPLSSAASSGEVDRSLIEKLLESSVLDEPDSPPAPENPPSSRPSAEKPSPAKGGGDGERKRNGNRSRRRRRRPRKRNSDRSASEG